MKEDRRLNNKNTNESYTDKYRDLFVLVMVVN